jgi:hypothetical protein
MVLSTYESSSRSNEDIAERTKTNFRKGHAEMGKGRIAGSSSRDPEKTRRAATPRFADDHLEGRQSPRSSGVSREEV